MQDRKLSTLMSSYPFMTYLEYEPHSSDFSTLFLSRSLILMVAILAFLTMNNGTPMESKVSLCSNITTLSNRICRLTCTWIERPTFIVPLDLGVDSLLLNLFS